MSIQGSEQWLFLKGRNIEFLRTQLRGGWSWSKKATERKRRREQITGKKWRVKRERILAFFFDYLIWTSRNKHNMTFCWTTHNGFTLKDSVVFLGPTAACFVEHVERLSPASPSCSRPTLDPNSASTRVSFNAVITMWCWLIKVRSHNSDYASCSLD